MKKILIVLVLLFLLLISGNRKSFIPEFFGIEFGEMEISTGLVALVAAIGLPMWLFRKKKKD